MKYHVLHIETRFEQEWQQDVFDQALCDRGIDTIDGNDYYIPSDQWAQQKTAIQTHIAQTEGAKLLSVDECPNEDWNATWEAEHPIQELPLGVRIIPHCAFGAGHHETTSMMIEALLQTDLTGKTVLDHGTGTGVLAIFAKKRGAKQVVAVDIDDLSVANAKENAALNEVEIEVRLGDCIPSDLQQANVHLILGNIHRNILLANMAAYAQALVAGGELWLSGFYESDIPAIQAAAEAQGLHLCATHANHEWRMLQFKKH